MHLQPVTKLEVITPKLASQYLLANTNNRPMRASLVEKYAQIMRSGNWIVTHQGIAFDDAGNLLDGQHRLAAIVASGISVTMLVTRNLPSDVSGTAKITTMDAIDGGRARTIADQLHLNHGIENATMFAASANTIAMICGCGFSLSVTQCLGVLDIYGDHIKNVFIAVNQFKPLRRSSLIATLSFIRATHPDIVDAMASGLFSGESLKRGDPTLALRNWLIAMPATRTGGSTGRMLISEVTANCAYNKLNGIEIVLVKRASRGLDVFRKHQKENIQRLKSLIGITNPSAPYETVSAAA